MKLIDFASIPYKSVPDKKGLQHRAIIGGAAGEAKNFEFIQSQMEKGGMGSMHSHPHSEHILVVSKGKLRIYNSKEENIVSEDQGLYLVPGEEHEVENIYDGTTHYFVIYAPPR